MAGDQDMSNPENFTEAFVNVTNEQQRTTHTGMAYWAGSGPSGKTCRECERWLGGQERYGPARSKELKPAPCEFYKLRIGGPDKKVPNTAAACKYFKENPNPPKRFD